MFESTAHQINSEINPFPADKPPMMTLVEPVTSEKADRYKALALESLRQLPPFSPVFTKLMESLARENVSVAELADWIEKDAIIAGQLLRTVNSSAYGIRGTVSSVRHAIAVMGISKLRNLALGLSVLRIFTRIRVPKSWSTSRYNLHSAATAIMADQLVLYRASEFGEGAFIAGLLHDIGRMVIAISLTPQYEVIQQMELETGAPIWRCEQEVLGFSHAELAGLILQRWNLPKPIQVAAETHHYPPSTNGGLVPLGQIVSLANDIVNKMGICINPTVGVQEEAGPILAENGWGEVSDKIIRTFVTEFQAMRGSF